MAREYFCAYHSYLKAMRKLSDAECGRLFRALLLYSAGEQLINLQGREEILFDVFSDQIDRDNAKYESKCEKNRENGMKANGTERYQTPPNATGRPRTVANAPQEKEEEKDKDKEEEKKKKESVKKKVFCPPTLEEVKEYCQKRNNRVDPEIFFEYFNTGNWIDSEGKPVRNWKQKLLTWEGRKGGRVLHGTNSGNASPCADGPEKETGGKRFGEYF